MRIPLIIPQNFNETNRRLAFEAAVVQMINPELINVHRFVEGFENLTPGYRMAVMVGWDKERKNLGAWMTIV